MSKARIRPDGHKPIIITGCGRSGTQWLGHLMRRVLGEERAAHEPHDYSNISDVVVDGRLRSIAKELYDDGNGHEVIHLVRDGRDVVRSLHRWYKVHLKNVDSHHAKHGGKSFEGCCREWAEAVNLMRDFRHLRLEDLTAKADPSKEHNLPHWTEWDDERLKIFWNICGEGMKRYGYE